MKLAQPIVKKKASARVIVKREPLIVDEREQLDRISSVEPVVLQIRPGHDKKVKSVKISNPDRQRNVKVQAPARIITRRNQLAIDKNVKFAQPTVKKQASARVAEPLVVDERVELDPISSVQPVEVPVRPALIRARRFTTTIKQDRSDLSVGAVSKPNTLIKWDILEKYCRRPLVFAEGTQEPDHSAQITSTKESPVNVLQSKISRSSELKPSVALNDLVTTFPFQSTDLRRSKLIQSKENQRPRRQLAALILISQMHQAGFIRNDSDSEDSDGPVPKLSTNPIEYLNFLKKKLKKESPGVLSNVTNLPKP